MDVNVTAEGVAVLRLKAIEPEDAADDGIAPGASTGRISPVRRRDLKTAPDGARVPIFLRILRSPTGVALLLSASPTPNLEVETGYWAILMLSRSTNIS